MDLPALEWRGKLNEVYLSTRLDSAEMSRYLRWSLLKKLRCWQDLRLIRQTCSALKLAHSPATCAEAANLDS